MIIKNRVLNGFLIKHKIKTKFINNCKKYPKSCRQLYILKERESSRWSIVFSFKWEKTPEKYEFWYNIHIKYRRYHKRLLLNNAIKLQPNN